MNYMCADLQRDCEKCGDDHYSKMTKWAIERLRADNRDICYKAALKYSSALDALLTCLKSGPQSVVTERRITFTIKYQMLLARDVTTLLTHGATLA